jgi:hypothetical protein
MMKIYGNYYPRPGHANASFVFQVQIPDAKNRKFSGKLKFCVIFDRNY